MLPENTVTEIMDDQALLKLLQINDSQFPIGSFAHSAGLETYAQEGLNDVDLSSLLEVQLELGWGRLDLAATALAWDAENTATVESLCCELSSWKVVPGLRRSSLSLGRRLLKLAVRLFPGIGEGLINMEDPHQAIVFGVLGRRLGIGQRALVISFGHNVLLSSLSAATRCMPLSPERAQEILIMMQPRLVRAVARILTNPRASLFSATPAIDLRAHQQAYLRTRLFQS
jgi:urease accessory protein